MDTTENTGVNAPPEAQGYDLVLNRHVGITVDPDSPYDPLGTGTKVYGCPDCGATWNADDLHADDCPRTGHSHGRAPVHACPGCNPHG